MLNASMCYEILVSKTFLVSKIAYNGIDYMPYKMSLVFIILSS